MTPLAYDTETVRFRNGSMAPELVCVSYATAEGDVGLLHHKEGADRFEQWLGQPVVLVGHNLAYDMAVMCAYRPSLVPAVFQAYEEDRATCTMRRQQLLDIAAGQFRGRVRPDGTWAQHNYGLDDLSYRFRGSRLTKDTWRTLYGRFLDVPIDQWVDHAKTVRPELDPYGVVTYPKEDAMATIEVFLAQEKHAGYLDDQYRQARAYFALHLASVWGVRTDLAAVDLLEQQTEKEYDRLRQELEQAGLIKSNGVRDTKAAKSRMTQVFAELGRPLVLTATGEPALDSDACKKSEDHLLIAYSDFSTFKKVMTTDVAMLRKGTQVPVHARYDMADSGRTTCSKPNLQNLRRLPGIRESVVPRSGHVFAQADYPQLELYTLAQACYDMMGYSSLGEALKKGIDPHLKLGATILGCTYEEAKRRKDEPEVKNARNMAKPINFGYPGGLGAAKLVMFAWAGYKVLITEQRAKELKQDWFRTWPEMPEYFRKVDEADGIITLPRSKRTRGGCSYCAAANTHFQGRGSDIAKSAAWKICKACYVKGGDMYGSRMVIFVHDEFITETPDTDDAHDVAWAQAKHMVAAANEQLPDVPVDLGKLEPTLMRYWSKAAFDVYSLDGRLVPWDGSEWVTDSKGKVLGLADGAPQRFRKDGSKWDYL